MKKKIVFVMESLRIGGAEKSLVTLLSLLDKDQYDIYLYLFRNSGPFLEQLPKNITMIQIPLADTFQINNFKSAWLKYLSKGSFKKAFYSMKWLAGCIFSKYIKRNDEYIGWKHLTKIYTGIEGHFDAAVGYLEKKTTYFVVDHVDADKKIAFMHTDYDLISHNEKLDAAYYTQINRLAVVSEHTKQTMLKHFPDLAGKIAVIKNMVSSEIIMAMSEKDAPELNSADPNTIIILTVGRLTAAKHIDSAIKILKKLRDDGIEAEWYVVGEGEERAHLETLIQELCLEDAFHLLGARSNPYPYMKLCDIYVQPSRWEGFGITVTEAKVLSKPIITSDIPEFREQLRNGKTGLLCANENEMYASIKKMIEDKEFRYTFAENLSGYQPDYCELDKFMNLLEA